MNRIGFRWITSSLLCIALFVSCSNGRRSDTRGTQMSEIKDSASVEIINTPELSNYIIYLENSGSMFGYVSAGGTDFVKVVSGLASNTKLSSLNNEFFLINAKITNLGNDKAKFNEALSLKGLNQGDPKDSDLNKMIDEVMGKANDSTITILISDGIYSLTNTSKEAIENNLILKSGDTKTAIFKRLNETNLSVVVVKLKSLFKGKYYPALGSSVNIEKDRPYYVWIFGPTEKVTASFPLEYIESLPGYVDMSHFVYVDKDMQGNYQLVSNGSKGKFKFSRKHDNELEFEKRDRQGDFQFGLAVDFSKYPFPQGFFLDSDNYDVSSNYEIINIEKSEKSHNLPVWATHLITLKAKDNPIGKVQVRLLSKVDGWIEESATTDDSFVDENTTFGLMYLMEGISDAFKDKQNSKYLTEMNFNIVLN